VLREHDTLARIGGDEFVIVIEPWHRADRTGDEPPTAADDRDVIDAVANRILNVLRQPVVVDGRSHVVSASLGITYAGSSRRGATSRTPGDVLQEADAAMYRAKHWGKDRFEVFEHGLRIDLVERGRVEQILRRTLTTVPSTSTPHGPLPAPRSAVTTPARADITAAYQPIFDLDSGRLTGFEALARLTDEDGRDVAPDVFIPVAEQTGQIRHLGSLMLQLACAQLAAWQTRDGTSGLTMAVNVSALQAAHSFLGDDVRAALRSSGLHPSSLVLELTETVLLQAGPSTLAELCRLHDEGVGIAIDDFGTGYASLRYLATLPVTAVKIDRSFTVGLPDDPTSSKIVTAVAGLAADMGLVCVVEGVETAAQRSALPPGVRVQGYLTGHPLSPALLDLDNL
jgi:predicted signal transduction protein with EAL and GGDEF domain